MTFLWIIFQLLENNYVSPTVLGKLWSLFQLIFIKIMEILTKENSCLKCSAIVVVSLNRENKIKIKIHFKYYIILLNFLNWHISISILFTFAYSDVTRFRDIWSESSSNIFSNPRLKFTLSSDFGLPLPR